MAESDGEEEIDIIAPLAESSTPKFSHALTTKRKTVVLSLDTAYKADEENRDINIMRRKSVAEGGLMYKAKEILREDPYPVGNPEYRPLTEPLSPMLMTKMRAESQSAIKEATFQPTFPL